MRRFVLKLLLFISIVITIDISYGVICGWYRRNVKAGMTRLDNIATYETEADVLVFGSSRARRHYDTDIISDSLNMTAFNCGYNSMGIEFFYPRLCQIMSRYTPKVIIYDFTPLYDIMECNSKNVNIKRLKPFFGDSLIYYTLRDIDHTEWLKLHSATYRYHGEVKDYIADQDNKEKFVNGYAPLKGTLKVKESAHSTMTVDSAKIQLWHKFLTLCRERSTKVYFVISPYYKNDMGDQGKELRQLASAYQASVFDHFNDPDFVDDASLYWDASHLNSAGAEKFSSRIMHELMSNQ